MARLSEARRIGLLGGTFNPVHIGHLRGALEVAEFMALDELRLIPSARPPHREAPQATAEQRLAMVELAVAEGTIVTWRTDESIPVGFGTIQVVPVWRFLLEMNSRT